MCLIHFYDRRRSPRPPRSRELPFNMVATGAPSAVALEGTQVFHGEGEGPLLVSDYGISFWGEVDPVTGLISNANHPLHGENVAGKVFCFPSGKGSCTGSQVVLELILNDKAPAAIVLREASDEIIALGALVGEQVFQKSPIPILVLPPAAFDALLPFSAVGTSGPAVPAPYARVQGAHIHVATQAGELPKASAHAAPPSSTPGALLALTERDNEMLEGKHGPAKQLAMRIVCRMAELQGCKRLIDVSQGHIDAVTYIGRGGLRFAQRMVELGGKVAVPTTLNSTSIDRQQWRELGVDASLGNPTAALADAYLALGAVPSFTCAPYLLESAPKRGEHVAWGESNAVVFANSVLGARTQKYADYLDVSMCLVGRAPLGGCHEEEGRLPQVTLELPPELREGAAEGLEGAGGVGPTSAHLDALWPVLGYLTGKAAGTRTVVVRGLGQALCERMNTDALKAFCAAFGTSGAAAMVHVQGVTPEAEAATATAEVLEGKSKGLGGASSLPSEALSWQQLQEAWRELDGNRTAAGAAGEGNEVQLVSLGNPHLSVTELAELARLVKAPEGSRCGAVVRPKAASVSVVATVGRDVRKKAAEAGHVDVLEEFGVTFVSDTCWCMLTEPVVPPTCTTLITNSAKYAHYAPGLVGRAVRFGSLQQCVDAAVTGKVCSP